MKEQYIELMFCQYLTTPEFMKEFGGRWISVEEFEDVSFQIVSNSFAHRGFQSDPFLYRGFFSDLLENLENIGFLKREGDKYTGEHIRFAKINPNPIDNYKTLIPVWERVRRLGYSAFVKALKQIDLEIRGSLSESTGDSGSDADVISNENDPRITDLSPDASFFKSDEKKQRFINAAGKAHEEIQASDLSNAQKVEALGYLTAAQALSDVPEPPVDLIWDILTRANNIAGVGTFFLTLIMLLAMVAG